MRREVLLVAEIIDACERVIELTSGMTAEGIEADRTRREALDWSYAVLGEACSQLPDEFKSAHANVPWRSPTDLRNRVVHGYWQISTRVLIAADQDDIPGFAAAVRQIQGTRLGDEA